MHELLYYSIFAIILYFVLTQVFENFNIEQENFDPSLVPVSSIVTLAKVAQKLVNGNGTLTNPGNLQIGASASAPGNLTVTGSTSVGGGLSLNNTGANFLNINKGTSVDANSVRVWRNDPGELHLVGMNAAASDYSWPGIKLDTRNSKITANTFQADGNATVSGSITSGINTWHKSVDGKNRTHYGNNSRTYYGSGDGSHEFRTGTDAGFPAMILNSGANLSLYGSITTGGGVDGITSNAGSGHLHVKGVATVNDGINIPGSNGNVSMPEVNGDAGVVGAKGLSVGNLTMGKHAGDAWDYLRAGSQHGLLLSAASKNIYVWGQNNLRCQNELTVDGTTTLKGAVNINNLTTINHDLTATGNLRLCSNPAANGISIGAGVGLPTGNRGLRMGGNLQICDPADVSKCATLVYDSAKGILRLDSGLEVRNALGKPGDNNPGIITPNLVFSHADYPWTGTSQSGIQNYSAKVLNHNWIPNGSQTLVGARGDYEGQLHGSVKRAEPSTAGRIISIYYNTVEWDGKYYFN